MGVSGTWMMWREVISRTTMAMTLSEFFEKEIGKIGVFASSSSSSISKKKTFEKQYADSTSPSIPFKRRRQYVNMLTDISSMIRAVDTKLSTTSPISTTGNTDSTNSPSITITTSTTGTSSPTTVEKKSILQQYIDEQWEEFKLNRS